MKLRFLLAASAIAIASTSAAYAADAVAYEEPAPVVATPVFSWTGPYIGAQAGYGWGKSKTDFGLGGSFDIKPDGFLGGLYAGYNFDVGNNVILGIDGDITYNDLSESKDYYLGNDGSYAFSQKEKLRWSGAVRARAGYAVDRFLPYIAGGVAFGNVKSELYNGDVGFSSSKTLTGWTLGAGVDYAATDNLILRLEYRYTDYGDKDLNAGGLGYNVGYKTNDVRLGLAYKF